MKRILTSLALLIGVAVMSAACTSVPNGVATAQQKIAQACSVVEPTLVSLQATLAPTTSGGVSLVTAEQAAVINALVDANAKVCANAASIDVTSVQSLINTAIPAAIQVVNMLPLAPQDKLLASAGLIAFQTALSAAVIQFGQATVPASSPTAASAPVAAS